MEFEAFHSEQDESVNFTTPAPGGMFEARYVRRRDDYFIAYLSSHAGCDRACRFCHLTATGQTSMAPALMREYIEQARVVIRHYMGQRPAERVNFNFMARGEPLANPVVLANWKALKHGLSLMASAVRVEPQFNISTIMPRELAGQDLKAILPDASKTAIFYSLYSMRPEFRRRWLPKAMDVLPALEMLAKWQRATGGEVVLHWAFIEGENDDHQSVQSIANAVRSRGLKARFNLVRYNPYSDSQGREAPLPRLERLFEKLSLELGDQRSRIVPRVGLDVKASCGMFMDAEEERVFGVFERRVAEDV